MLITRYGHAALLIETDTTRILIDPGAFSSADTFELTDLDAIVVTHQHPDHFDPKRAAGLLRANPGAVLLSDPQTAATTKVGTWTENSDGFETSFGDLLITGVGAEHAEILPEIDRIANVGVLVRDVSGASLFHPGDSYAYSPGDVDVLAVPLSAPWAKLSETVAFVREIAPRTVFPIHDETISDLGYDLYWDKVASHGGVDDAQKLAIGDRLTAGD